jgi:hypothetical protein
MLARHPGTFMPPMKEVHYFDTLHVPRQRTFQIRRSGRARRLLHEQFEQSAAHRLVAFLLTDVLRHKGARRYIAELRFTAALWGKTVDDEWYASLFEGARPDQVACDFTPAYALLPPAGIEHVRRLNPDARILIILRDPIERALSHARMLVVRNGAPRTSESLLQFLNHWAVRSRDDCVAVLDRWQAHWPQEQFKVLFYDDIRARPFDVLADVCDYAGLRYDQSYFPRAGRVVYRGPSIPATDDMMLMLRQRFEPILAELARRYPTPASGWGKLDPAAAGDRQPARPVEQSAPPARIPAP